MDGRIEAGFRHRFRTLLALTGAKRLDFGVDLLLKRGRERAATLGLAVGRGLADLYEETHTKVKRRLDVTGCSWGQPSWGLFSPEHPPVFLCDPSLGGVARWLRAAGYEAEVGGEIAGHRLPDEAVRRGRVLLTTEAEVLQRRIVADGSLVVVWVPSTLTMKEQLRMVMRDLGLTAREARCMSCGGVLVPTAKEEVAPRIPPRTAKWLDEYFVCADCDRLFWQGTHWERIAKTLEEAAS